MVSRMRGVDLQNPLARQSAETWVRSEAAAVTKQTTNTGGERFHFGCIFQIVWRNKDRSRSDPTR